MSGVQGLHSHSQIRWGYSPRSLHSHFLNDRLHWSHKCGFNAVYHLESANGENVGYILREFVSDYGSSEHLTLDGAAAQVGRNTHFQKTIRKWYQIPCLSTPQNEWKPSRRENPGDQEEMVRRNGIGFRQIPMHLTESETMEYCMCVRQEIWQWTYPDILMVDL